MEMGCYNRSLGEISMSYKGVVLPTILFKIKENLKKITGNTIKNIIQQNNYPNQYFETIGYQLNRIN